MKEPALSPWKAIHDEMMRRANDRDASDYLKSLALVPMALVVASGLWMMQAAPSSPTKPAATISAPTLIN